MPSFSAIRSGLPVLISVLGLFSALAGAAADSPPGPLEKEFPVTSVFALLRPASTQRLVSPVTGRLHLTASAGNVAAGETIGRFDDAELRADLDLAQLRLRAARQAEEDFAANAPARRQEAEARVSDLEGRIAMVEAVTKNPGLLHDLPAGMQATLNHADVAALRAQLATAKAQAGRADSTDDRTSNPAHLTVLEAERAVRATEKRLNELVMKAPFAGDFQPAAGITPASEGMLVSAGQDIGALRNLGRVVAAVPALSPYLVRVELEKTFLRIVGPGGKKFEAAFREGLTESSPVLGEARVFLYEFSEADSRALSAMVQTNVDAAVLLRLSEPVAVVGKIAAALAHPDAFSAGWSAGVPKAWPGWVLVCEGESSLGCAHAVAGAEK